jgi:hypothetical protein
MGSRYHAPFHPHRIGDQVNSNVMFKDVNVSMPPSAIQQHLFDGVPGQVASVDDPLLRMPPFQTKIKFQVSTMILRERDPPVHELPDTLRTALDNHLHNFFPAESVAGLQGVLDMKIKGIMLAKDRRYTPLRIVGTGLHGFLLGHNGHSPVLGDLQSKAETGNACSNDQEISFVFHSVLSRNPGSSLIRDLRWATGDVAMIGSHGELFKKNQV